MCFGGGEWNGGDLITATPREGLPWGLPLATLALFVTLGESSGPRLGLSL